MKTRFTQPCKCRDTCSAGSLRCVSDVAEDVFDRRLYKTVFNMNMPSSLVCSGVPDCSLRLIAQHSVLRWTLRASQAATSRDYCFAFNFFQLFSVCFFGVLFYFV